MTDQEFDILDELYFLTGFEELKEGCGLKNEELVPALWKIIKKEWVNCFKNYDQEFQATQSEFETNFADYHYLASKKGLMAHNAR